MGRKRTLVVCVLAGVVGALEQGDEGCPCIEWADLDKYRDAAADCLYHEPFGSSGPRLCYPPNYGNLECKDHDAGLDPFCAASKPPEFCSKSWCYVDKDSCDKQVLRSSLFPEERVYYSYQTCGASASYPSSSQQACEDMQFARPVKDIVEIVKDYVCSAKTEIEAQLRRWSSSNSQSVGCEYIDSCPCTSCKFDSNWNQKVDLTETALVRPASCEDTEQFKDEKGFSCGAWRGWNCSFAVQDWGYSSASQRALIENCPISCQECRGRKQESWETACVAQSLRELYGAVAGSEYSASGRVGYQFFGSQEDGSNVFWPSLEWCPTVFDSRFRPWYAAAASGPKEVMLVLDASGSMCVDPTVTVTEAQLAAARNIEQQVLEAGGAVDGEIVISLGWPVNCDLDLHVITPSGNHIYFGDKEYDRGILDVDMLSGGVENIAFKPTWEERVPRGAYQISVNVYSDGGHSNIPATVTVKAGGCMRVFEFTISSGMRDVFTLEYGGVDAPGTTGLVNRMQLARRAAVSVLNTLTDADYAGIVAFDGCVQSYKSHMVRVTDEERESMKKWVLDLIPGSTTSYEQAFQEAFRVMSNDRTFQCAHSSALLFLTDGRPDEWTDGHYAWVQELNQPIGAAIMTYTLGDDVDQNVVRRLACENNGVYRHVAQAGELDSAMAQYYHYFSGEYRGCDAMRWIEYDDSVTCSKQLTGCLPIYSPTSLYGVACMDVNILVDPECLKAMDGWTAFEDEMISQSHKCGPNVAPDVAALRAEAGEDATCGPPAAPSGQQPEVKSRCEKRGIPEGLGRQDCPACGLCAPVVDGAAGLGGAWSAAMLCALLAASVRAAT